MSGNGCQLGNGQRLLPPYRGGRQQQHQRRNDDGHCHRKSEECLERQHRPEDAHTVSFLRLADHRTRWIQQRSSGVLSGQRLLAGRQERQWEDSHLQSDDRATGAHCRGYDSHPCRARYNDAQHHQRRTHESVSVTGGLWQQPVGRHLRHGAGGRWYAGKSLPHPQCPSDGRCHEI